MMPLARATATELWSASVVQERMICRWCSSGLALATVTFWSGIAGVSVTGVVDRPFLVGARREDARGNPPRRRRGG